jgi:WXG100 family type VII secretion target
VATRVNLVQASYKNLRKQMTVLQNGDWIGLSAQNFFEEMNTVIFPAFERLENAFLEARLTTLAISDTFQQAELDVAEIFKLNEGGSKGKGLSKSDNSSNHPWDADGFGWWAEAFSKQHNGRLPSEQDMRNFGFHGNFLQKARLNGQMKIGRLFMK